MLVNLSLCSSVLQRPAYKTLEHICELVNPRTNNIKGLVHANKVSIQYNTI